MGDYTSAQLIVFACPPEEVREFNRCIDEYELLLDFSGDRPPHGEIQLGHTYCANDVNIGFVNDYSIDAPNSAWMRWNDPLYEYLGDLEIHVPGLGYFKGECDSAGTAVIRTDRIVETIKALPEDCTRDQVLQAIERLGGASWLEQLTALATWEPGQGPVVKAAPICAWCEELIVLRPAGWIHKDTWQVACTNQVVHIAEPEEAPE